MVSASANPREGESDLGEGTAPWKAIPSAHLQTLFTATDASSYLCMVNSENCSLLGMWALKEQRRDRQLSSRLAGEPMHWLFTVLSLIPRDGGQKYYIIQDLKKVMKCLIKQFNVSLLQNLYISSFYTSINFITVINTVNHLMVIGHIAFSKYF